MVEGLGSPPDIEGVMSDGFGPKMVRERTLLGGRFVREYGCGLVHGPSRYNIVPLLGMGRTIQSPMSVLGIPERNC